MGANKNTKLVKLRAFKFENNLVSQPNTKIMDVLSKKLKDTNVKERRMVLNNQEEDKEEDLISYYEPRNKIAVMGIVMRIAPADETHAIPDNLFDKNKIEMTELQNIENEVGYIQKDHYYFYLNDRYVITTLRSNLPIIRFQTYLNWLLSEERQNNLYEISPIISLPPATSLNELKSLSFTDTSIHGSAKADTSIGKGTGLVKAQIKKTALDALKELFVDTKTFEEIKNSQILNAEILIKFVKPKGMKKEEFTRFMAATLKPISECDNVILKTKNHGTLKGSDIQRVKNVEIELTDSGNLSEPDLWQKMEKFVNELDNEDDN